MARIYQCPACGGNKSKFILIYKIAQEVTKDPTTGETLYYADELETLMNEDGSPDMDIRCSVCGYTGAEKSFIQVRSALVNCS